MEKLKHKFLLKKEGSFKCIFTDFLSRFLKVPDMTAPTSPRNAWHIPDSAKPFIHDWISRSQKTLNDRLIDSRNLPALFLQQHKLFYYL